MSGVLLAAEDLHYAYHADRPVLAGVSLAVRAGEVVALLGANGGGKSTLLKLLLGLLEPSRGTVRLDGRPLRAWSRRDVARRVAYIPQTQAMPFPYKVRDLVALGRIARRGLFDRLNRTDHAVVDAALARLAIADLAERPYTELSGGQRQLCLIARALAQEAPVIVMDEPATGLDYGNQWRLLALVRELAAEGRAFVQTTHHPEHALGGASRVVMLYGGRVVEDGAPLDVVTPEHVRRLYGLGVTRHRLADGNVVLVPQGASHA
ncbi:ABC transporter ATP-binding protein [Parasulfuritortus cantonensis]|uniref:ABC transporter ATP-binding protein n=1 Tax=Parasulfuritortus cantonensis TaxID=2528202 RepID=A0A4R1B1J0_9PROT|nr:ABC transporter ATP-binding protein [Parasulfuritortus cantonensis]TCJ11651.1 ABC transporter ATP-binding protein [Parasulfuritortus cantonensis]